MRFFAGATCAVVLVACCACQPAETPVYSYRVVHTYPHDRSAFTQGMAFHDGYLYEGTGMEGRSVVRRVRLETGEVMQEVPLDRQYFGEGIAITGEKLIQLTWTSGIGFVYDRSTFSLLTSFRYQGQAWGLTSDGRHLIMSDGSAKLRFWDPQSFAEVRHMEVRDQGRPVTNLNELEVVEGEIFANVWQSERIARISPADGRVLGWIDLSGLLSVAEREGTDVLNGIAYDREGRRLFVTGKWWPQLFEIEIRPKR